ncbi:MAG: MATE family efflux transporter, partial [Pseudomonadota bacterium]
MTSPITFSRVVALALPAAAASAATPLLGLIDAVALGRSPDPLEVGAVGLAGAVFSALYWTFGFLRMSTSGLAAQATGEGSEGAVRAVLARSVLLGALIGLALLALRPLIETIAFAGLRIESEASEATFAAALEYFGIRLWAAPAALATYAATGWLTGRGHTGVVLAATLAMTSLNAGLDWWFVAVRNEGAAGVALGTAIAEAAGLGFTALGCLWVAARKGGAFHQWRGALRADPAAFAKLFATNRDVFIRTALLVFSFVFFTQRSSSWGDVTLAANQILLQLFLLTGLALDGPAIAAESLVGQAVGRGDRAAFDRTLKYAAWATALAALPFALAYLALGDLILSLMTTSEPIRAEAGAHLAWVALSPLAVALAFLLDGIFIGATRGKDLRDMMIASFAVYMALWFALAPAFGNHGHWAAFILYF